MSGSQKYFRGSSSVLQMKLCALDARRAWRWSDYFSRPTLDIGSLRSQRSSRSSRPNTSVDFPPNVFTCNCRKPRPREITAVTIKALSETLPGLSPDLPAFRVCDQCRQVINDK